MGLYRAIGSLYKLDESSGYCKLPITGHRVNVESRNPYELPSLTLQLSGQVSLSATAASMFAKCVARQFGVRVLILQTTTRMG